MAFFQDINLWAVLVAAVAFYALGALWYSPVAFAGPWMELLGRKREDMGNPVPGLVVNAIATLVSAGALAIIIVGGGWTNWVDGLGIGALCGVGFVMTVLLNTVAFEGRPIQLFFINAAYQVIGFCLMGTILGAWH